jgi:hypothetical protein
LLWGNRTFHGWFLPKLKSIIQMFLGQIFFNWPITNKNWLWRPY